jgi:pimeloyl-ACP methyl ester carboxylesterase
MKVKRLLVISDISGNYPKMLVNELTKEYIESKVYNVCELAEINSDLPKEERHKLFVSGGIEKALQNLNKAELDQVDVVAFSIGGIIVWRAALQGLKTNKLTAYSSTLLRYETKKPTCEIELIYGATDDFKPAAVWFERMDIKPRFVEGVGHGFYMDQ